MICCCCFEVFALLAPSAIQMNIKVGGPAFTHGNTLGNGDITFELILKKKLEMRVCKTLCPQLYACP